MPSRLRAVAAALIVIAILLGLIALLDDDQRPSPTLTPAERQLPVAPQPSQFDGNEPGGVPLSATDEIPGKTEAQEAKVDNANEVEEKASDAEYREGDYDTSRVLQGAAGQPAQRKCPTPMNGGGRLLSEILLGVAHVTVSRNLAGTRDGEALCGFFRRVKASPNETIDNEGNRWENVELTRIPWTQAWYNRRSCAVEYIGSTGRPGEGPAEWTVQQLQAGARFFARCFTLAKIPARNAITTDAGKIVRSGFTTHQELGRLGGGHTDPGPFFMREAQLYWIRIYMADGDVITRTDRIRCSRIRDWRRAGRPAGAWERKSVWRRRALERRQLVCTTAGVRRR